MPWSAARRHARVRARPGLDGAGSQFISLKSGREQQRDVDVEHESRPLREASAPARGTRHDSNRATARPQHSLKRAFADRLVEIVSRVSNRRSKLQHGAGGRIVVTRGRTGGAQARSKAPCGMGGATAAVPRRRRSQAPAQLRQFAMGGSERASGVARSDRCAHHGASMGGRLGLRIF